MTDKNKQQGTNQQEGEQQQANYNPTARNFDQRDVSGEPEKISGNSGNEGTGRAEGSDLNESLKLEE